MELYDYLKFRWKVFAALAVLGAVAILVLGLGLGKSDYTAKAQLIVRPPADTPEYASNPDRYISTEMAVLNTEQSLRTFAKGTDVTPAALARSLSYTHTPGTDVVTLGVTRSDQDEAVLLVNKVADDYISDARQRNEAPAKRQAARLREQVSATQQALSKVNARIENAANQYARNNPDRGIPSPSSLSPKAYSQQTFLSSQLQRLSQAQVDLALNSDSPSQSRVLNAATGASAPQGWGPTTFVAAVIGLLLVLLTLAMVGLALSKRVLSEGRWADATSDAVMIGAVRLRRRPKAQRRQSTRRVVASLRAVGPMELTTQMAYLPEKTATLEGKTTFLIDELTEAGVPVREADSLAEALPAAASPMGWDDVVGTRVLLLVDRERCRVDEAALLPDYPEAVQRRIVPVLV